ncbi:MAG: hypothetical protein O9972_06625 [Burkholderiales bacterium]|nr:hypothetical protein [Burkholderiales bacterium]
MSETLPTAFIELRLSSIEQLFHRLDPLPFREGDLSPEVEEYIVESARELPKKAAIAIRVHVPEGVAGSGPRVDVGDAIRGFFAGRAKAEAGVIRDHFGDGRSALVIGLAILATCLLVSWQLAEGVMTPVSRIAQESLVIVGWVAIWRPAEIFLYDWLPLSRRRRLFQRLAAAQVTLSGSGRLPAGS